VNYKKTTNLAVLFSLCDVNGSENIRLTTDGKRHTLSLFVHVSFSALAYIL